MACSRSRLRVRLGSPRPRSWGDRLPRSVSPWWAPALALVATGVLVVVAKVLIGRRGDRPEPVGAGGSAHAPDPLTGDPTSIDAADVAPV